MDEKRYIFETVEITDCDTDVSRIVKVITDKEECYSYEDLCDIAVLLNGKEATIQRLEKENQRVYGIIEDGGVLLTRKQLLDVIGEDKCDMFFREQATITALKEENEQLKKECKIAIDELITDYKKLEKENEQLQKDVENLQEVVAELGATLLLNGFEIKINDENLSELIDDE